MADHTDRIMITDALGWDCVEGECEHSNEAYMNDFENCPKITMSDYTPTTEDAKWDYHPACLRCQDPDDLWRQAQALRMPVKQEGAET